MTDLEKPAKKIYKQNEQPADETALTVYQLQELNPGSVDRNVVLTHIYNIDEHIATLERDIKSLSYVRSALMRRVVSEDISEDAFTMAIKIPGKKYRNPIVNELLEDFKKSFPQEYMTIREKQVIEANDKFVALVDSIPTSEIPLGEADLLLGKETVASFTGYKPQVITIGIRKKSKMLER